MRYIIGFFITIGLLILLIVLLVTGGNDKANTPNAPKTLESYARTSAEARLTIEGPVNAPEDHRSVRISVGRDSTTYEQFDGYNGQVAQTETFGNTENSYSTFLRAIKLAGFTQGSKAPALKDDRGYCPLGKRYIFEFLQNGKSLQRYWATSCKGLKSFEGNTSLNISLFKSQVPGYQKLNSDVDL